MFAVLIAAWALALAWPGAAHAAGTYYVSVIGTDTVGSGSIANPFATVQKAVKVAGANGGGVVSVGVGMFSGDVTMTASEARVSIEGVNPSLTTLRGDGHNSVIYANNVGVGVTISGLSITGGGGSYGGGGITCYDASPTITGDTIIGNSAVVKGGGIYSTNSSSPRITGDTIIGNSAAYGGGIYCQDGSPTITGNTISGNSAQHGGGLASESSCYPTITGNTIAGNSATNSGGGIFCDQTIATITGNTVVGNNGGTGGGGIDSDWAATMKIANTVIAGNRANFGAGVYAISNSQTTMVNDVVAGNQSSTPGGGIYRYVTGPTTTITNCVVWGNGPDGLYQCVATYSDVSGGGGGVGDISVDPSFVDATHGDYHLTAGSPCLDDASPTVAPATDRDGIARPWGAGYDMGAYEYFAAVLHTTASLSAPSSVKVNKSLKLNGTVSPWSPPGKVTITKTRLVGKKWKSAGSAKVSVAVGKFSYSFKPKYKGSWHFTASYSGGVVGPTTYLSSRSGVKGVKVK